MEFNVIKIIDGILLSDYNIIKVLLSYKFL
jgi:hypothetical protein